MLTKKDLEEGQIRIYIITIIISILIGLNWEKSHLFENLIDIVIGVLLYSMFCQIPFLEIKAAFKNRSFFKALLLGNFVFIPLFVWLLLLLFPGTPVITLGVALVLLTPCIDYVIVFAHLGQANSNAILASTPVLLLVQMICLPLYLWIFLGLEFLHIIDITPFLVGFIYMIILPLLLAVTTQLLAKRNFGGGSTLLDFSGWLPVPLMALTFFTVIVSQIDTVRQHAAILFSILPIYILFSAIAPFIGKFTARLFKVDVRSARAVSFSISTRNSLVVLPLALALPAPESTLVAMVIVTQTIVEILFELIYIKCIPALIKPNPKN